MGNTGRFPFNAADRAVLSSSLRSRRNQNMLTFSFMRFRADAQFFFSCAAYSGMAEAFISIYNYIKTCAL